MAAGDPLNSADAILLEEYTIRKPLVRLIQQAAQSLPHNTNTAITYAAGSEDIDTHGWHDVAVNNTRITAQFAGYYTVRVHVQMATAAATNYNQVTTSIAKNGTRIPPQTFTRPDAASNAGATANTSALVFLGIGDYVEHFSSQANGAATAQSTNVSAGFQSTMELVFERP